MEIRVSATPDQLELQLGLCHAALSHPQAMTLRESLAEILLQALHLPRSHWEVRQTRALSLRYLADTLLWMPEDLLRELLSDYPADHLPALVRYAQRELPALSERIHQLLSRKTAELLDDQLSMTGAIPVQQVVLALEALHPLLRDRYGKSLADLPAADFDPAFALEEFKSLHRFLNVLPSLPVENSRRTLKQLELQEKVLLLWLARKEGWQDLEDWLLSHEPQETALLQSTLNQLPPPPLWQLLGLARRVEKLMDLRHRQPQAPSPANPALEDKARSFLANVSELPAPLLQLLLKRLSRARLAQLFTACHQLQALTLLQRLEKILPERFFQQMQHQHPEPLELTEIRSLMARLSQELKQLKNPQQTGTES